MLGYTYNNEFFLIAPFCLYFADYFTHVHYTHFRTEKHPSTSPALATCPLLLKLSSAFPLSESTARTVESGRKVLQNILDGKKIIV